MAWLDDVCAHIEPVDPAWLRAAEVRHSTLTKPRGSLGALEPLAARLCGIHRSLTPPVTKRRIVVFAADHGVTIHGVSPFPSAVTAQMVLNFLSGGAAINALARVVDAELLVVDVGVATPYEPPATLPPKVGWRLRRVGSGTADLSREPAMSLDEVHQALAAGIDEARDAAREGVDLLGMGEMGIGNTTAAAAMTALVTEIDPHRVTGPGTGAVGDTLSRKRSIVADAVARQRLAGTDPLSILRGVGGLEIAALVGLCLGAAAHRVPVLVDGFITTAAAAVAVGMCSAVSDYLLFAHRSAEPGHGVLLQALGATPLLDLDMRLGEGTGAALAMPMVAAAARALTDMASFEDAGVARRSDP